MAAARLSSWDSLGTQDRLLFSGLLVLGVIGALAFLIMAGLVWLGRLPLNRA